MNRCSYGGILVSAEGFLPQDPSDFFLEGGPIIGCNHLTCGRCKQPVRHIVGWGFRDPNEQPDIAEVYATADLTTSRWLAATSPRYRLYLCRCSRFLAISEHTLEQDDPGPNDPQVPWRCTGHPLVELPRDVDGMAVASDADVVALTRRALGGQPPEPLPRLWKVGIVWLRRIYARFAGTALQAIVAETVARALEDPSPAVRARALQLLATFPDPIGMRALLAVLEGDRQSFVGVADESTTMKPWDSTLEDTLWRAAAPLVAKVERARAIARAEALTPGKGRRSLYDALATHDSEWLIEHIADVARADPSLAKELEGACDHRLPVTVRRKPIIDAISAAVGPPR